ncbi:hypothetical protein GALL_535950 [mine drainage metagenome]|uniref:Uncharacterized protein n=1 Tax=mine drainage metagenome TaxID=410659 RepID=A0A1J5PBJ1_9ZZZZ
MVGGVDPGARVIAKPPVIAGPIAATTTTPNAMARTVRNDAAGRSSRGGTEVPRVEISSCRNGRPSAINSRITSEKNIQPYST